MAELSTLFRYVPTDILDAEKDAAKAKAWGDAQRAAIAKEWGDLHRADGLRIVEQFRQEEAARAAAQTPYGPAGDQPQAPSAMDTSADTANAPESQSEGTSSPVHVQEAPYEEVHADLSNAWGSSGRPPVTPDLSAQVSSGAPTDSGAGISASGTSPTQTIATTAPVQRALDVLSGAGNLGAVPSGDTRGMGAPVLPDVPEEAKIPQQAPAPGFGGTPLATGLDAARNTPPTAAPVLTPDELTAAPSRAVRGGLYAGATGQDILSGAAAGLTGKTDIGGKEILQARADSAAAQLADQIASTPEGPQRDVLIQQRAQVQAAQDALKGPAGDVLGALVQLGTDPLNLTPGGEAHGLAAGVEDVAKGAKALPDVATGLRNAISGTEGGSVPTSLALHAAGAVGGGVAGYETTPQGATPVQRAERTAAGAAAGLGATMVGRGLFGKEPLASLGPSASSDPADRAVAAMLTRSPTAPAVPIMQRINSLAESVITKGFDDRELVRRIQEQGQKAFGRPLNADEMAYTLSFVNPGGQADLFLRKNVTPILASLDEGEKLWLANYLIHRDNVEKATAVGERARQEILARDIREPVAGTAAAQTADVTASVYSKLLATAEKDLAKRQADLAALQAAGKVGPNLTLLETADSARFRAAERDALAKVTQAHENVDAARLAAETNRATQAAQVGASVREERQFSAGLRVADSERSLANMPSELGPTQFAKIDDAAQKVDSIVGQMRDEMVSSGVWTQAMADEFAANYPHYVPDKILDFMDANRGGVSSSAIIGGAQTNVRRLTEGGTALDRENPLASVVRMVYETKKAVAQNNTFTGFLKLRDVVPGLDTVVREVKPEYHATNTEHVVNGFVAGVPIRYVMPKDLGLAVENDWKQPIPGLNVVMNIERALLASRNPVFISTHAMITVVPYLLRTTVREGGPQALPRVVAALAKGYWDAFKGAGTGRYGPNTEKYIEAGGAMFGGSYSPTVKGTQLKVSELARDQVINLNSPADVRRFVVDTISGKHVGGIINRIDLGPRTAANELALARGANPVASMGEGRTSTLDFAQAGQYGRVLNSIIPFANVGLQAPAQIVRAFGDNPHAFATTIGTFTAPVVAAEAWNRANPQREADYEDVPDYIKNRGLVLMLPGNAPIDKNGQRRPQFAYIQTRALTPFVLLTRQIVQAAMHKQTDSWGDLLGGAVESVSPIPTSDVASAAAHFLPAGPALQTPIELGQNKTLLGGRTIETVRTNEAASPAGKAIAAASGNRIHPSMADYLLHSLGGPGQLAQSASRLAEPAKPGAPQDNPVLGPLLNRLVRSDIGGKADRERRALDAQRQQEGLPPGSPRRTAPPKPPPIVPPSPRQKKAG